MANQEEPQEETDRARQDKFYWRVRRGLDFVCLTLFAAMALWALYYA